jgi:hypothetical protein
MVDALKEEIPKAKPVPGPRNVESDLLNLYPIADYHLGAFAWGEETGGDDWDKAIAEELLNKWISSAIKASPKAKYGVLCLVGDFHHFDGAPITERSGHIVDADGRHPKLVRTAIRLIASMMQQLLKRHEQVKLIVAVGNHDERSTSWEREMFDFHYSQEPRVTVETSADHYYCHEFGNNALFFHHGHRRGVKDVDTVFAGKFREVFGRCKYSYGYLGHLHSEKVRSSNLMVIEQLATLAAPDAFAAHGGWLSNRHAKVITFHRHFGKCAEFTLSPEMVK